MAAAATTRTEHCTFNLDGDLEGENPRQWLKGLEEEFRDTDTEADKVMLWQRRMLADSEAEDWFDNLDAVTTSTHANLKTAFALQWLAAPRIKDSRERKLEKVRECILKEEDMFAKVDDANGKKVWGQVKWVTEIAKLAADAGDVGGVMINLALLLLPKVIQEALESDYATWAELSTAVLKLSKQKITLQAEKDRMMTEVLAKLERLSLTPAMKQQQHSPIIVPPPQWATQQQPQRFMSPNPFITPSQPAANTMFTGFPKPNQTPQTPQTPTPQQLQLTTEELRRQIIPHHPNTEIGRRAYMAQITWWNLTNPGRQWANISCPYPLTPGTAPIGSHECYRCAIIGQNHGVAACTAMTIVPEIETSLRAQAANIAGVRGFAPRMTYNLPIMPITPIHQMSDQQHQFNYYQQQQQAYQDQYYSYNNEGSLGNA